MSDAAEVLKPKTHAEKMNIGLSEADRKEISAGLSVIGAIVGEFLIGTGGGRGGLGVQIIFAQGQMHTALLFAEIFAATLLGFLFFSVVSAIGNLVLRGWHESAA